MKSAEEKMSTITGRLSTSKPVVWLLNSKGKVVRVPDDPHVEAAAEMFCHVDYASLERKVMESMKEHLPETAKTAVPMKKSKDSE